MMKCLPLKWTTFVGICLFLTACHPLSNDQADIEACSLSGDVLREKVIVSNDSLFLIVVAGKADPAHLSPRFQLSQGATIDPASGTERDFTHPQHYEVCSQDGQHRRKYTLVVVETGLITSFDFEHWQETSDYEHPYQIRCLQGSLYEKQAYWSSGNGGFALTGMAHHPEEFPTCKTEEAHSGCYALKMETKSAGMFGRLANKPIAAGSLFIGSFDASSAVNAPLQATKFGQWFNRKPIAIKGYYRYSPGNTVTNAQGKHLAQHQDTFNISGVLYETNPELLYLDATNTINSRRPSSTIIASAYMEGTGTQKEWTAFEVKFDYEHQPNSFDKIKANQSMYKVSISLSSSKKGGDFIGAVGSKLWIDDLELICE